jgi:hypothetical protein
VRRRLGFILLILGLVAAVVGTAAGCGTFFSFNGKHPIAIVPITLGTPVRQTFNAQHGMRYTLSVQVVFEREGLPEADGKVVVEAQLPLAASLDDSSGVAVAKAVGWFDPNEPPTVLYGMSANPNERRPAGVGPAELVAERIVGAITVPRDRVATYSVDLGPDRLGKAIVKEARAVVYDDKLPASITAAFITAAAGAISFTTGALLLFYGLFRARRGGTRRRQKIV